MAINFKREEREMSFEERIQWVMRYTDVELENLYITEKAHEIGTPTKVITITEGDKVTEIYNVPKIGAIYRHFKGDEYKVLYIAKSSDGGIDVVYQHARFTGQYYTRPLNEWFEEIGDGYDQKIRYVISESNGLA